VRLRHTEINGLESEPALQEQCVSLDPTMNSFKKISPKITGVRLVLARGIFGKHGQPSPLYCAEAMSPKPKESK
jgi:hypothetical protein